MGKVNTDDLVRAENALLRLREDYRAIEVKLLTIGQKHLDTLESAECGFETHDALYHVGELKEQIDRILVKTHGYYNH